MRIAHILPSTDGGGAAHVAVLARHLRGNGVESRIFAPDGEGEIERLPGHCSTRAWVLLRLAAEVDVLHVHGTRAAAWALPALARGTSVVTLHGLHPLRRQRGGLYRGAAWALLAAVAAAADALICVSRTDFATLEALPVARAKRRLIRNAVPPPAPLSSHERERIRRELGIAEDELAVVFVGRLHDTKDPLLAVRAVGGVEGMRLLVVGDGPLRNEVARLAARWPNVAFLGAQTDAARLMTAGDVVLSTSRWEGLPLAVLEAMWLERPVVASQVPGNDEAIQLPELLVVSRQPEAFREALERLRDSAERARVAAVQRSRVEREFPLERMLGETEALYRQLVRRR